MILILPIVHFVELGVRWLQHKDFNLNKNIFYCKLLTLRLSEQILPSVD